jgi:hypothetical protein
MQCGKNCWQPQPGHKGLYDWYRHLFTAHVTRKMWHDLSVTRPTDNVWLRQIDFARNLTVLGPFSAQDKPNFGLDTAFIDEGKFDPTPGAKAGGLTWRQVYSPGRELNLGALYYPVDKQCAYVAAVVRSPKAQKAQLRLGIGNVGKVWQNGKLVLTIAKPQRGVADQYQADVKLIAGDNLFVVKAINDGEDWTSFLRVCDKNGKPLPGVTYAQPGKAGK